MSLLRRRKGTFKRPAAIGMQFKFNQYRRGPVPGERSRPQPLPDEPDERPIPLIIKLGTMGLILVVVYRFGLITNVSVNNLTGLDPGQEIITPADYEQSVKSTLERSWYRRFKPFTNAAGLERQLLGEFSNVSAANVSVDLSRTVKVAVAIRRPVAGISFESAEARYVDGDGIVFNPSAQQLASSDELPRIVDQSGFTPKAGEQGIPQPVLEFILNLNTELTARDLVSGGQGYVLRAGPRSVELTDSNKQSYVIKFAADREVNDQIGELNAILSFLRRRSITPAAYIDLRVDDTAYYK